MKKTLKKLTVEGLKMLVREGTYDEAIAGEIFNQQYYTAGDYGIGQGDVVVDIGAHIGAFSLLAASCGAKEVTAYEPEQENFNLLKKNIKQNRFEKVITPIQMAVAGSPSDRSLYVAQDTNLGGHSFFSALNKLPSQYVKCVTLGGVLAEKDVCDFLKVDCEGAEYEVFYEASRDTLQKIKKVVIEYHRGVKRGWELVGFLENRGFTVTFFTPAIYKENRLSPLGKIQAKR